MELKRKIGIAAALLIVLVLSIWGIFYIHSANNIRASNQNHLQQVSAQIADRLENELLMLESMSYALSRHEAVQAFSTEENALLFHQKSAGVDEIVGTLEGASGLGAHIIIFGQNGAWANFAGAVGHAAASTLQKHLANLSVPRYRVLTLESIRYICYARNVGAGEAGLGTVVLLVEESQLLGLFSEYITTDGLAVSLAEDGTIVASSNSGLLGQTVEQTAAASLLQRRKIGFAPFEILVGAGHGALSEVSRDYGLAALLTVLLLIVLLVLFARLANRHLFRPMLHVMRDVEALGSADEAAFALRPTGEAAFDGLVRQINQMLARLEEKSRALLKAQTKLQSAEIERQQALIVSLKKQINAHFTVNVLNDIKALAEAGETEKAAEVSDGLSHLLRYANAEDEFIDGMEELFVLEKYITIMGIRYGSTFTAEYDWDDRLGRAMIPRMLLQPLVENAIVHGLAANASDGLLKVTGRLQDGKVHITVEDNGIGMSRQELRRVWHRMDMADRPGWTAGGTERVALANIRRRLRSYYHDDFAFSIESRTIWGTTASLSFPDHY
ncbi:histidine kinase [Clostridia bacterium OttesenSCG-928-O13]|nr:histidine kinase [Clostridia bacterium OttesenSCG-928-O13]